MNTEGVGRRIAYWREHRGLTQAEFGRLMGQSRRWVQDWEGGQRQSDPRLSVMLRAAEVLRIPLERLVTNPSPASAGAPMPAEVAALADALHDLPSIERAAAPPSLTELRRRLAFASHAWVACHYVATARELPGLLADAHLAAASSVEGATLLSRTYQLAASLLYKYSGNTCTPGVLAADRALAAAHQSGDPVVIGSASRRVARGLIHQQRHATATEYATAQADALRPVLERAGTPGLSALGMLYLVAAVGASGSERSQAAVSVATDRLDAAAEIAERQGDRPAEDFTAFGSTNVALHEVDVLLRLDDAWAAVEAGRRITTEDLARLNRERRARHLVTKARALALTGRREEATAALVAAERLAPEEVRRPAVVGVVRELLLLVPSPGAELRGLAERCGLRA
ncbi:helix-turn-helix domain-containing protein [Streptomyces sp. 3MP-14]|uniref:Helix-turn-helix domain-containing protein n=1 Tax=Streptomyces mimosae TaxID=2586635 RepID=A0A5N6AFG8_9ACTN|nr:MULTISPECIES: helix-turn-helix transcriptional regulator [Streptomyces]KAB8166985.1 helix-turn-helix domain-containing protein [Streptomyces mimosae]KAB8176926.1 helix-turn-helix domain-containing protein [Streptomyces sp. 3MP-14]